MKNEDEKHVKLSQKRRYPLSQKGFLIRVKDRGKE
jgi:hypothetical protein